MVPKWYARNPNHPLHSIFIALAGAASYAASDGGAAFKDIIMKAKGFTSDSDMDQYLQQNGGKIDIGLADRDRWVQN